MHLGLREGAGYSEDHSFVIIPTRSGGDEGGVIPYRAVDTDFVEGASRVRQMIPGRGRERHFPNSASSSMVSLDSCVDDTLRVLTPSIYMVAMADLRARSLRDPCSRSEVRKGELLSLTCGTWSWSLPRAVW
jgi:hypothetical protein